MYLLCIEALVYVMEQELLQRKSQGDFAWKLTLNQIMDNYN